MADELSETAGGATKGLLAALGFILILLGGEILVDKTGERFWLGLGLAAVGILIFFLWVISGWLQQKIATGTVKKLDWIFANPAWWVALVSVFTTYSLNQLGFVPTTLLLGVLGIVYAIYSWRRAGKVGTSRDAAIQENATATDTVDAIVVRPPHNPQVDRDLLLLLDFAVYQTTALMLEDLIRQAPPGIDEKKIAELEGDVVARYAAAQEYISHVRGKLGYGTLRHSEFLALMDISQTEAERHIELTPPDQRPAGIDHLHLRRYAIAHRQCWRAIAFLREQKAQVEENIRNQRHGLIERFSLRSKP